MERGSVGVDGDLTRKKEEFRDQYARVREATMLSVSNN